MSTLTVSAASVPAPAPAPRRRWWPWGLGCCLAPFVALGLVAWSVLTLDRDAAALREAAMSAAPAAWNQKVVLDIGRFTFDGLRTAAGWVQAPHMDDVRQALRSVEAVSVGVYQRAAGGERVSPAAFLAATDGAMQRRGWTRLVGVDDAGENVVIYVPAGSADGDRLELCLAVVAGRELVVVKARVDAKALGEWIASHLPEGIRGDLSSRKRAVGTGRRSSAGAAGGVYRARAAAAARWNASRTSLPSLFGKFERCTIST